MANRDNLLDWPEQPRKRYTGSGTPPTDDDRTMPDVTRYELDAKLEAIEARMDGRVASIESKIDGFLAVQAERDKASDQRFQRIETDLTDIKGDFKSLKGTIVVTATTVVLTIVIGVAGFNAMLTSNMLSAFQAGLNQQPAIEPVQPPPPQTQVAPAPQAPAAE